MAFCAARLALTVLDQHMSEQLWAVWDRLRAWLPHREWVHHIDSEAPAEQVTIEPGAPFRFRAHYDPTTEAVTTYIVTADHWERVWVWPWSREAG